MSKVAGLPAKIAAYLVSIGWLLCLALLYGWRFLNKISLAGTAPGFFLGGGALIPCSTSTPINRIVFFLGRIPVVLENRRSSQGGGVRTPCTLPLDPSLPGLAVTLTTQSSTSKLSNNPDGERNQKTSLFRKMFNCILKFWGK